MWRSLEFTFEEIMMKNVPIDLFRSFKWRNGVQNWNLHEKKEQNRSFQKFYFLSMVNAKGQSQRVVVKVNGAVTGQIRDILVGLVRVNRVKDDAMLTWRLADVAMLAWRLTCLRLTWLSMMSSKDVVLLCMYGVWWQRHVVRNPGGAFEHVS